MKKIKEEFPYPAYWAKPPKLPLTASVRAALCAVAGRHAKAAFWREVSRSIHRMTESEEPELWHYLSQPDLPELRAEYDILMVSNVMLPPRGGGTRSFLHLGRQLVEAGLRVAVICGGPAIKAFRYAGMDVRWLVHDDDLPGALRETQYRRVLCQQDWAPVAGREAAAAGKPFWYFLRSIDDLTPSRPGVYSVEAVAADAVENREVLPSAKEAGELIGAAEVIVANSKFMGEVVRRAYGRECKVIYPGIDAPDPWETGRTKLSQHILSMGGSAKKGIHLVLEMARALPGERFILCGVKRLPSSIKVKELPSNVHWLGQLDPKAAYAMAKIVLMPSQWPEPAGRVCPEALMRGIPVLASRVGGIPEIVREEQFLVDDFTGGGAWKKALKERLKDCATPATRQAAFQLGEAYRTMQRVPAEWIAAMR
jgi:glycosyltransferase involved in cell wall biosynthesis